MNNDILIEKESGQTGKNTCELPKTIERTKRIYQPDRPLVRFPGDADTMIAEEARMLNAELNRAAKVFENANITQTAITSYNVDWGYLDGKKLYTLRKTDNSYYILSIREFRDRPEPGKITKSDNYTFNSDLKPSGIDFYNNSNCTHERLGDLGSVDIADFTDAIKGYKKAQEKGNKINML